MSAVGITRLIGLPLAGLLLVACQGGVEHYEVAKAKRPPTPPVQPAAGPVAQSGGAYRWQPPAHWTAGSGSSMRLATLVVPHEGERGDLSISVFGGDVAGNVNRWRGQIGLESRTEAELLADAVRVESAAGEFLRFHLVNPEQPERSILAGMHFADDGVLFVKLTASAALTEAALADFDAFLATFAREAAP